MTARGNVVSVKSVSFGYDAREAVSGVSCEVGRGDYLLLTGGNGSGKTTLIKIMLGLLSPSAGSVSLFGTPLREFRDWGKVGYVPQRASAGNEAFPATVREVALMGRYGKRGLFRRMGGTDHARTRGALEQVGMWEHRDRLIGDLSGGERQRVFLARALATEPEVMFLDEPTINVEQAVREEFYALLGSLNRNAGLTIVLVTHDVDSAVAGATHVLHVDRTVVFSGGMEAYLRSTASVIPPHHA